MKKRISILILTLSLMCALSISMASSVQLPNYSTSAITCKAPKHKVCFDLPYKGQDVHVCICQ